RAQGHLLHRSNPLHMGRPQHSALVTSSTAGPRQPWRHAGAPRGTGYRVGGERGARTASPNDQTAVAGRATSWTRNWPRTLMAGNPPSSSAQVPGVVTRKLRVLRNIPTASRLPAAETRGSQGRAAIRSPTRTSVAPSMFDSPWTPNTGYVPAKGRLFSTNGRRPSASLGGDFLPPLPHP